MTFLLKNVENSDVLSFSQKYPLLTHAHGRFVVQSAKKIQSARMTFFGQKFQKIFKIRFFQVFQIFFCCYIVITQSKPTFTVKNSGLGALH